MTVTTLKNRILAMAAFAIAAGVCAAQTNSAPAAKSAAPASGQPSAAKTSAPAQKTTPAAPAATKAPASSAASEASKKATETRKLSEQAKSQLETWMTEHEALLKQLKDATEDQKNAILEKMQQQQKQFAEAQGALHKQMKEDQRRQRQNAAPKR